MTLNDVFPDLYLFNEEMQEIITSSFEDSLSNVFLNTPEKMRCFIENKHPNIIIQQDSTPQPESPDCTIKIKFSEQLTTYSVIKIIISK